MTKLALCIGINNYPGTSNDLSGCVNDANDWATVLENRGFQVSQLLDAQASKAAMVTAINELIGGAAPKDSIAITYSGHGTWVPDQNGDEPDGRDEALCPCDVGSGQVLLDDEIRTMFAKRAPGVRVLLISDSCFSGSVTRGDNPELDPGQPRARFLPPASWMPPAALPKGIAQPSRLFGGLAHTGGDVLLAGCSDTQVSWDTRFNGRPNGAFTFYALKALKALHGDASYQDWLRSITPAYLPSNQLPQSPQIFGNRTARLWKVFT